MNVTKYSKQLMVAAGLLALPFTMHLEKPIPAKPVTVKPPAPPEPPPDPRAVRLKTFFCHWHCPISDLTDDFISAADENRIDWRLLPSISMVESGGGRVYQNNNIFGWANGSHPFPSVKASIHTIASKLGRAPLYRNRDVMGKLLVYNPDEDYADKVVEMMNKISPRVNLEPVRRLVQRAQTRLSYAAN